MASVRERDTTERGSDSAVKLVDADVHPVITQTILKKRLSSSARKHLETFGRRTMPNLNELYPRAVHGGMRADAWPEGDDVYPGSDPELARKQLLDQYDVDYAVLNCADLMICHEVPELAHELARGINDSLWEGWLDLDSRFVGAVVVPAENPSIAVAEIERCAADERWVQVILPTSTEEPLGSPKYRPIFRAATDHGLPVAIHLGGYDPHRGTGWPSYYIEEHVGYAIAMESQLLNMICEGVFEELPDLRIVLSECGVAWMIAFGWALDAAWELLRDEVPTLQRRPTEVIHDQVWFTTQPIEEPAKPEEFLQAIERGRLGDRLLFSTDYPHWDFDSPLQALPRALDPALRARIFSGNACELWKLPGERREAAA